jgi:hypothetical protein
MDCVEPEKYIALPTQPDFIPFTVPYICLDAPYDYLPGGFYDFPERQGWILYGEPENPDAAKFHRLDSTNNEPLYAEKVEFLQAWFFFGVLAEVSSITGLAIDVAAEFVSVSEDEDVRIISTGPINGLVERWLTAAAGQENWKNRLSRIHELSKYVKCRMFSFRNGNWTAQSRLGWDAETKVLLSIEIVFRALLLVLARSGYYQATMLEPLLQTKCFDYHLRLWRRSWPLLRNQGYCPSEMKILARLNRELPYSFFLQTLNLRRINMNHSTCGEFRCMADQIDEDTYCTVHVDPECACGDASPNVDEICSLLSLGKVPLILVSENLIPRVVSNHPFVAISHVCKFLSQADFSTTQPPPA